LKKHRNAQRPGLAAPVAQRTASRSLILRASAARRLARLDIAVEPAPPPTVAAK
jgi:hypothetical protein